MTEKRNVRVLVLEDSPERIKAFKAFFGVHNDFVFDADFADDADHAFALFREGGYDLIFLDHDLGEGSNPNPDNNGAKFTKALREFEGSHSTALVVVHSLNFPAAGRMMEDVRQAGIAVVAAPFVWNDLNHAMNLFLRAITSRQ